MTKAQARNLKVGDLVHIPSEYAAKFDMDYDIGEVSKVDFECFYIRWASDDYEGNFPFDLPYTYEHIVKENGK